MSSSSVSTDPSARALGQIADVGSIEPGKKADLIVVGTRGVHQTPGGDPYSQLVYASRASDVRATLVDGQIVAREGRLVWADVASLRDEATSAARTLVSRAGI